MTSKGHRKNRLLHVYCDQCQAICVNNIAVHEQGCPHTGEKWIRKRNYIVPESVEPPK